MYWRGSILFSRSRLDVPNNRDTKGNRESTLIRSKLIKKNQYKKVSSSHLKIQPDLNIAIENSKERKLVQII